MSDVLISYEILNQLNGSLKQILVEFEEASHRSDVLEGAIAEPCGRNTLKHRASDFESGWDDRRSKLKEDLAKVQEHVEQVGEGWQNWDTEASKSLKVDSNAAANLPKKG